MAAPNPTHRGARFTPRDRKKAATWRRIRAAAAEVFESVGFREASLDKVAERAGVAKGTLYRHVDSKADLYVEVLLAKSAGWHERIAEVIRVEGSALERLHRIAMAHLEFFYSCDPDPSHVFWAIDNQEVIGEIQPELLASVTEHFEISLQLLEGVIRQGIENGEIVECDPWLTANVIWTLGDRYFELRRSPARQALLKRPLDSVYREGLQLILHGLSKR